MVHRALLHVAPGAYLKKYKVVSRKRVVRSIFFNSSQYMDSLTCAGGEEVTKERVARCGHCFFCASPLIFDELLFFVRYEEAKEGRLRASDTMLDIDLHYLSLHEVEILDSSERASSFRLSLDPIIRSDKVSKSRRDGSVVMTGLTSLVLLSAVFQIMEARALYRCDCKAFLSTGWACSHVVATMALANQYDLDDAIGRMPTKKLSGGQRRIPGALFEDDPGNRTLSHDTLTRRLLKAPGYPVGWQVGKDFVYEDDGVESTEFILGRIKTFKQTAGVFSWKVAFQDGDVLYYECEEIVQMIVATRRTGLDVTRCLEAA